MMEVLQELIAVCRVADTDKVTERKKQVDKLRLLLGKSHIVKALDRTSDIKAANPKKHQSLFAWDILFKVAKTLVWREADSLRKAKEPQSSTAQNNREKKKQEVSQIFKMIVRQADKRGNRLKGSDVVQHVLDILDDPFCSTVFGPDHSSVLLKDILSVHKYWCELNFKTWHELIGRYCGLLKESAGSFDRVVLARVVVVAVTGAAQQCDLRGRKLIPLLEDYFKTIKQERSMAVIEHMVSAVNTLSRAIAVDGRVQLCRLGENIFIMLVYLWKQRPTERLKDEIVEFFQLQLNIHHPLGAKTEDQGAFAVDWDLWKRNMRTLYEAVYNELEETGERHKFVTGKSFGLFNARDTGQGQLKANFVSLVADLCFQLYSDNTTAVEVTQISFLQTQPGSAKKKRRIESGWAILRDHVTNYGHTKQGLPWVQLLTALLRRYPDAVAEEEFIPLLSALAHAQAECRTLVVLQWLLHCLEVFAHSQHQQTHDKISDIGWQTCGDTWQKVWASVLRSISFHHAVDEGFQLLQALIECHLVVPNRDLWTLFLPCLCPPSQSAVFFLSVFLQHYDLPESYRPSVLVAMTMGSPEGYLLRCQLVDWTLPDQEELSEGLSNQSIDIIDPHLLGETLVSLTLRDSRSIKPWNNPTPSPDRPFREVETIYLQTSFDQPLCAAGKCDSMSVGAQQILSSCVGNVQSKLDEALNVKARHLLAMSQSEAGGIEAMVHHCSLLLQVLASQLDHGMYDLQQLAHTQVFNSLKDLMKRLGSCLVDVIQKDGVQNLSSVLSALMNLFEVGSRSMSTNQQMSAVLRALTPAKLIDQLLQLVFEKSKDSHMSAATAELSFSATPARGSAFHDLDLEMDYNSAMDTGDFFEDEDVETSAFDSQESEGVEGNTTSVNEGLLSKEMLTENQLTKITVVQILCRWCKHETENDSPGLPPGDINLTCASIRKKLLYLIDEDNSWDCTKAYDLQLLKCLIEGLVSPQHLVHDQDMETMVEAIRLVCKYHRRDQHICHLTLDLVSLLVPHLAHGDQDIMLSTSKKESREVMLHILGVFWKLSLDDQYTNPTRLAVAHCILQFLKVDPNSEWTVWSMKGEDGKNEKRTLREEFPRLLQDKNHRVRLAVAAAIGRLFSCDGKEDLERSQQDDMFTIIYNLLQDVMTIEGRCSPDEQQDEAVNRTSSLLHTLARVALSSVVCEKKAIFAACQMVQENSFDLDLVKKVLCQVGASLGADVLLDFMSSHLPYFIHHWLDSGYKLNQFPYQLLGYSTLQNFYSYHYQVVLSFLVMREDLSGVKEVCNAMGRDWVALLSESLPHILIHILPLFAASKDADLSRSVGLHKKVKHATSCYRLLTDALSEQIIEQSVVSNLEEIIVGLLLTLYDVGNHGEGTSAGLDYCRRSEPEPNPPHFNSRIIRKTLDYLTSCHSTKVKSLVALLAKSQDSTQRVLLSLRTHLSQSKRHHMRRQGLRMYRLFIQLLLEEFQQQLGGSWAYVLRDVIFTLIHTVQMHDPQKRLHWSTCEVDMACMCFDLLEAMCRVAVQHCPEELCRFLPAVISCQIPYIDCDPPVGSQSLKLLNFLIVENAAALQSAIRILDPFPSTRVFDTAREIHHKFKYDTGNFTLHEEVFHFLEARRSHLADSAARSGPSHLGGLRFLHQQLSSRKPELVHLVEECEDLQSEALLVKLVYELIELSKSTNKEVAQEACRCLGEIGPIDLSVVALKPRQHNISVAAALEVYKDDSLMQRNCKIFHLLDQLLLDGSVEVVTSASQVLKQLLATKSGINFYTNYKSNVTDHLFQYLHPFKTAKKKPVSLPHRDTSDECFEQMVSDNLLWAPLHGDHARWVKRLASVLIDSGGVHDELLVLLKPICDVKVEFCETILPFLVHDILLQDNAFYKQVLSSQISNFFSQHCRFMDNIASRPATPMVNTGELDMSVVGNQASVRVILNIVQYLRHQELPPVGRIKTTPWDRNFWLDLDYLHIAKAAQNCCAYFTTMLYAEIWCDQNRGSLEAQLVQDSNQSLPELQFSQSSQLENLTSLSPINVQSLLLEASRCIGDPDGVYGCGAGRLTDPAARIKTYEHEDNWPKAITSRDLQMEDGCTSSSTQVGLLQALQNFGASHVLDRYLQGISGEGQEKLADIQEFQFQCAWRNCRWDLDTLARFGRDLGYHQSLYGGLAAMKDGDITMATEALNCARLSVQETLRQASLESCRSLYPALSQLLCISQAEDTSASVQQGDDSLRQLLNRWQRQDPVLCNDFDFLEPVLHQRCVILHVLRERLKDPPSAVHQALVVHLENAARRAREAGRYQLGERYIHQLASLGQLAVDGSWSWQVEEARMFWCRAEHNAAKHLMKNLLRKLDKEEDPVAASLYPKCLGIYGDWLAETRSENPSIVMEKYLSKAVDLLEDAGSEDEAALDAFLSLARFADSQYQNIVTYMKSSTFESKQALAQKAKQDAEQLKQLGEKNCRYLRTLEKQSSLDEDELTGMMEDKDKFLHIALVNYLKCLQRGDKHDMRVFRLTSLWFENLTQKKVNVEMKNGIQLIKLHKFLPLMYQLAARLSQNPAQSSKLFQETLDKLIECTVIAHPHHTLNIVLALAHANKDLELTQQRQSKKMSGRLSRGGAGDSMDTDEDRVRAAKAMVRRLKQSRRAPIVVDMERLCVSYIVLANWNVEQFKRETKPINLPESQVLLQMKHLTNVAVPTIETPVDPTGKYLNIVYVEEFKPTFKLAGGINLPKIISCVGSDGRSRRQLVKGRDDLRQDAVMQQVFGLVNTLLHKVPETRKRKLKIRTYKVIPLSQRSGLLEWCEGTVPLGDYLIGSSGAHYRYRPNDLKAPQCRQELQLAHDGKSKKNKYEAFLSVCKRMQPVFRHFFLEKFPEPADWYEKRLAYTRSVATNSIVGYILGLGDRHVQNILIDCESAELVHIDLGVAFEQGRILPTPETVPFRLTRDIVDGMGVAGVEGVFRRCCEKTMEVMHQSQEALLTILQVLLYDPLYAWTISPLKAYALQQHRDKTDAENSDVNTTSARDILDMAESPSNNNEPKENVNKVAERVLLRLQQKLQGLEDGVQLSVSGQVNHLIQDARDPKNLCRLFSGWQPYI